MTTRRIKVTTTLSLIMIALTLLSMASGIPKVPPSPLTITQASPLPGSLTLPATLHARGASFPAPLIFQWASAYHAQPSTSNVTLYYQSMGSGAGQRALINKTDDFDASDAPLSAQQRILTPNILHIPETIGSVTLSYNLTSSSIGTGLNLSGAVIAQIYLGQILTWNDPAIKALNPGVANILPNHSITTVHRSDSSGTTFVFTSFLSQDSATWATTVGASTDPGGKWPGSPTGSPPPIALTGAQNPGVAQVIKTTPFSIGYVELNYALSNNFPIANVQNPAGNFVTPTLATTQNAVSNYAGTFPPGIGDWSSVSLLNQPGAQTYPIASFTYFLVYRELNVLPSMDINETFQATALKNFLYWAVNNPGQGYSSGLSYVPLPTNVRLIDNSSIASITFTINATPAQNTVNLSASGTSWNNTAITVYSGDTLTLRLFSADGATHQWFLDLNNNNILDPNETSSSPFSNPSTPILLVFTPKIGVNIPGPGNWIYKDVSNTANTGILTVLDQQIAAPFPVPKSLSEKTTPTIDNSTVTTIGSIIVDMRALTVSGNITQVAVDSRSPSSIIFTKSYLIPNLHLVQGAPSGETGLVSKVALFVDVLNYPLSTTLDINLNGLTVTIKHILSRDIDIAGNGIVSAIDVSILSSTYNFPKGNPNYNPKADLLARGTIDAVDASLEFWYYNTKVISS